MARLDLPRRLRTARRGLFATAVLMPLCVAALTTIPLSTATAGDVAVCKKQAAHNYAASVKSYEQNLRGLAERLR